MTTTLQKKQRSEDEQKMCQFYLFLLTFSWHKCTKGAQCGGKKYETNKIYIKTK